MVKISIEVKEINYEKSFDSLITQLIKECRAKADHKTRR